MVDDFSLRQGDEPALSIKGVALRLAVSERTVRRWVSRGQLRYCRVGRSLRVLHADLTAFVQLHLHQNGTSLQCLINEWVYAVAAGDRERSSAAQRRIEQLYGALLKTGDEVSFGTSHSFGGEHVG